MSTENRVSQPFWTQYCKGFLWKLQEKFGELFVHIVQDLKLNLGKRLFSIPYFKILRPMKAKILLLDMQ